MMHVLVRWGRFQFKVPSELTEEQYLGARDHPDEFRLSIRAQVRQTAKKAAAMTFIAAAVAALCFCLSDWLYSPSPRTWMAGLDEGGMWVGCVWVIAALFSVASFLHYTASARQYCQTVINAARESADYSSFLAFYKQRQQRGIGVDRKVPWWLGYLILAAVLAAVYFGLNWYYKV